jgi:hypothetical protein
MAQLNLHLDGCDMAIFGVTYFTDSAVTLHNTNTWAGTGEVMAIKKFCL